MKNFISLVIEILVGGTPPPMRTMAENVSLSDLTKVAQTASINPNDYVYTGDNYTFIVES